MDCSTSRLTRRSMLALLALSCAPPVASAQQWAAKMFKTTSHDFGAVARGSQAEFKFELQNIYEEEIHIADVRSSCGCTTPSISQQTLKTWEKAHVLAKFDTRSFLGQKSATVTVIIDQPHYAEVQLSVTGYIRSDVVFDPGMLDLGEIDGSETVERTVKIAYAGRQSWKITDVRSANRNFEVELMETVRDSGRVNYEMLVRLKPGLSPGYMQDQLTIVTDDANLQMIPLPVHARISSPLTVSPANLFMGVLQPGQTATKQLVVRANKPFRVLGVTCEDSSFTIAPPSDEARKLHFLSVTYLAGETPAKISQPIVIETDLGSGTSTICQASATITARPGG